jgi:hypothetical protein
MAPEGVVVAGLLPGSILADVNLEPRAGDPRGGLELYERLNAALLDPDSPLHDATKFPLLSAASRAILRSAPHQLVYAPRPSAPRVPGAPPSQRPAPPGSAARRRPRARRLPGARPLQLPQRTAGALPLEPITPCVTAASGRAPPQGAGDLAGLAADRRAAAGAGQGRGRGGGRRGRGARGAPGCGAGAGRDA